MRTSVNLNHSQVDGSPVVVETETSLKLDVRHEFPTLETRAKLMNSLREIDFTERKAITSSRDRSNSQTH